MTLSISDDLRLERYATNAKPDLNAPVVKRSRPARLVLCIEAVDERLVPWAAAAAIASRKTGTTYPFPKWPVDTSVEDILEGLLLHSMKILNVETIPFVLFWPDGALSSAIVTHDVETAAGVDLVPRLMDVDDEFGIKSSFQLVPPRNGTLCRTICWE